uniref:Uncharacterized protein n=1 Tax=Anguilla anguilla TaxID=7936 RepID=A0A0E9WF93_ANGAN
MKDLPWTFILACGTMSCLHWQNKVAGYITFLPTHGRHFRGNDRPYSAWD